MAVAVEDREKNQTMYELTEKQEKFARLIAVDGYNQTQAYKAAYDAENMADKTIWQKASGLAADGKVRARIVELQDPVIAKLKANQDVFVNAITTAAKSAEKLTESGKRYEDHRTRVHASKVGLDYLGYQVPQKNVNINVDVTKEAVESALSNLRGGSHSPAPEGVHNQGKEGTSVAE